MPALALARPLDTDLCSRPNGSTARIAVGAVLRRHDDNWTSLPAGPPAQARPVAAPRSASNEPLATIAVVPSADQRSGKLVEDQIAVADGPHHLQVGERREQRCRRAVDKRR